MENREGVCNGSCCGTIKQKPGIMETLGPEVHLGCWQDSYIDYPGKHPSDTKALIKNIQTIKIPVCLCIDTSVLNSGV